MAAIIILGLVIVFWFLISPPPQHRHDRFSRYRQEHDREERYSYDDEPFYHPLPLVSIPYYGQYRDDYRNRPQQSPFLFAMIFAVLLYLLMALFSESTRVETPKSTVMPNKRESLR